MISKHFLLSLSLLLPFTMGCGGSATDTELVADQNEVSKYLAEHGDQSVEDAEELANSK